MGIVRARRCHASGSIGHVERGRHVPVEPGGGQEESCEWRDERQEAGDEPRGAKCAVGRAQDEWCVVHCRGAVVSVVNDE